RLQSPGAALALTASDLLRNLLFYFPPAPTAATYTLSLHDALPIWPIRVALAVIAMTRTWPRYCGIWNGIVILPSGPTGKITIPLDRKSTRLNSSHSQISYAVFCLKKKKTRVSLRLRFRRAGLPLPQ